MLNCKEYEGVDPPIETKYFRIVPNDSTLKVLSYSKAT